MMKKLKSSMRTLAKIYKESTARSSYIPAYKVVELAEKEPGSYIATIQVINKNVVFHSKPEDILKDDRLVDQFSARDIRTLTYLGYLGINSPKYTILAKRLSENADKTIFALRERGNKKVVTKSAQEIFSDKNVLKSLSATDAHDVGFTVASDAVVKEKHLKESLKRNTKQIS